ncbi:hypothetical protein CIC12_02290 [Burkholderia sp. SG-MS1]|uniref:iron-sulfur cluster assembly protein n=1 Tax=Paraburkholderia sp. SG-MS1 TaxID=2023741 RepID=UPI001447B050|nr:iron-sulfur cluster assembly protein [Paraburkholderia sp. SG-MS1]NKJ45593.1 hypothetical protein [Paraburkholderia sp. SG-MS1]
MSAVAPGSADERAAQIWMRLAVVVDPELDESVTALGFVTSVAADAAGGVKIAFRLPTYWCAANFAFLMADDMRAAAASLPWVTGVTVELDEHMYAAEINSGVAKGLSFQQSFGDAASDDLAELRRTFLLKAFQRRQEALLTNLLARGHDAYELVKWSVDELSLLAVDDAHTKGLIDRYIERRFVVGASPDESQKLQVAFVDSAAAVLDPSTLDAYLRALRRVGVNAEFNGALCRGLLAARYGTDAGPPAHADDEHPIHFVTRHTYQEIAARNAGAG